MSLKKTAAKSFYWSAIEKFSSQTLQFTISIILARLLLPADFGLLAMIMIFFAIANVFIQSGLSTGLIQKHDRTDIDYSTVFVFNLVISLVFYAILWLTATYIADFYNENKLVAIIRVSAISLIINSFAIIQRTKLTINLDFRSIALINIISVFISGILSIGLAYFGYGVWSLVINGLANSVSSVALLFILIKWKPSFVFSRKSFRVLFSFGSKILLSSIIHQLTLHLYSSFIGKVYSTSELGYFNKAKSYADLSSTSLNNILSQVSFPLLASLQNNKDKLSFVYESMIRIASFVMFPSMILIAILAKPLILVLLTEKWSQSIVLLQWYAFSRIFYPLGSVNMNLLNATGRSDLFLKVEIAKMSVSVIILMITISISLKAIVIGSVISSLISFFIQSYFPGKYYGFGAFKQLYEIRKTVLATIVMSIISVLLMHLIGDSYMQLLFVPIFALIIYSTISWLLNINEFFLLKEYLLRAKN